MGATVGGAVGGDAAVVDAGTAVVGGDVVGGVVVGGDVVVGAAVVGGVVVGAAVVVVAVPVATFVLEVSSPTAEPMPPRTTIAATTQAMICFQRARFRNLRQGFTRLPLLSARRAGTARPGLVRQEERGRYARNQSIASSVVRQPAVASSRLASEAAWTASSAAATQSLTT